MKKMFQKINKKLVAAGLSVVGVASQAAVTVDPTSGELAGNIDTGMYSSGIPIVIGFIAFTLGVTAVISLLKRAK